MVEEAKTFDKERDSKGRYTKGHGPWKSGQSGNPTGRLPNIKYLSEWARELLQQVPRGELEGRNADELITLALMREALKGNTKAIEMLHDWTEGRVPDTHKVEQEITLIRKAIGGRKEDNDGV